VKTKEANSDQPSAVETQARLCGGTRVKGILAKGSTEFPLVTVITSVFNAREHIGECLESVLRQDYPSWEHVVIDGGSTDGTIDVLRRFDDRIALWRSAPDKGIYDAWNKGLAEARGEWICFLGADDELLPGAVASYMRLAGQHPEAEYLSSRVRYVHSSGYINQGHGTAWSWPSFAKAMYVAHPGSMHRRTLYERLGTYDISYRSAADYELLLRARGTLRAAYMPEVTAIMRGGGVSDTSTALQEAYRARVNSGGRNPLLARLDLWELMVRFKLLPLKRAVAKWMAR
jgi:glycosyltransferase involved in cell wall biosynthesis